MTFTAWRSGREFTKWHVVRLATEHGAVMQCGAKPPKGAMVSKQTTIPAGDCCESCMRLELAKCMGERERQEQVA